jgi:Na+-transporting NADH:ubiquinone oxidoreductase subunit NqrE
MKQKLTNAEIEALGDSALGKLLLDFVITETGSSWNAYTPYELCESLDAIAEVENIVIEKHRSKYLYALYSALGIEVSILTVDDALIGFATASPRARAEACLMALQGETE